MSEDRERFLSRWSRRKREARAAPQERPLPAVAKDAAPAASAPVAQEPAAPSLPPVESLTPESDFKPFMDPRADPSLRRAALKRLFSDAHFNVPDPYEAYCEDYTASETIPLETLKTLNQARKLLFDDAPGAEAATEKPGPADTGPTDDAGRQDP